MTSTELTLDDARKAADQATTAAEAVRSRIAAGDRRVTTAELTDAENAEHLARRQLDAALTRDQKRRDREASEQLALEREAIQQEWATIDREPEHLAELRQQAADAGARYILAAQQHAEGIDQLTERARAAGFRVNERTAGSAPSPLPKLARAILEQVRGRVSTFWTQPNLSNNNSRIWGT